VAKKAKIVPRPMALPTLPFSMCDRGAYINRPWVAVDRAGKEFLYCVYYAFADSQVHCSVVAKDDIDNYREGHAGVKQFYVDGHHTGFGPTGLAKTHLGWLKVQALRGGATPDAIRFMASALKLTKKEQDQMAKATTAKKTSGKAVGNGGKLGKKGAGGNAAGLEKAREAAAARNAENHAKKITVKVTEKQTKAEDFKLRGGRLAKLLWVIQNKPKTVGDAVGQTVKDDKGEEHKIDMGALRGMEKRGHISIG
jgi:hypothetical protein